MRTRGTYRAEGVFGDANLFGERAVIWWSDNAEATALVARVWAKLFAGLGRRSDPVCEDTGVTPQHTTIYCAAAEMLWAPNKKVPYFVVSTANRGDLVPAFR